MAEPSTGIAEQSAESGASPRGLEGQREESRAEVKLPSRLRWE
jgi:hypothetical protein